MIPLMDSTNGLLLLLIIIIIIIIIIVIIIIILPIYVGHAKESDLWDFHIHIKSQSTYKTSTA